VRGHNESSHLQDRVRLRLKIRFVEAIEKTSVGKINTVGIGKVGASGWFVD